MLEFYISECWDVLHSDLTYLANNCAFHFLLLEKFNYNCSIFSHICSNQLMSKKKIIQGNFRKWISSFLLNRVKSNPPITKPLHKMS